MRQLCAGRDDTISVSQTVGFELTPFRGMLEEKNRGLILPSLELKISL